MFIILLIIRWVEQWITLLYVLPTSDLTTVCSPAYSVSCLLSPRCFMYSNYSHTLTWLSWCLKGFSMDISNVFLHVVDMIVWNVSYGLHFFIVWTYSLVLLYSNIVPLQIWIKATVQPKRPWNITLFQWKCFRILSGVKPFNQTWVSRLV